MLELYEQNRVPPSQGSEVDGSAGGGPGSAGGGPGHRGTARTPGLNEEHASRQTSSRSAPENSYADNHGVPPRTTQNQNNDNGSAEAESVVTDHKVEVETKDYQHPEHVPHKETMREIPNKSRSGAERIGGEDQERAGGRSEGVGGGEWRDDAASRKSSSIVGWNSDLPESPLGQCPKEAIKMIDKDKVKAALEKRRKSRGETARKKDVMDEDDLIERELEDGVELAAEDEKIKRERRQSWSKIENSDYSKVHLDAGDGNHVGMKGESSRGLEAENAEEGEMLDDASPALNGRKRKGGSPADRQSGGKKRHDYNYNHDIIEDGRKMGRVGHAEHRRHAQENQL